MNFQRRNSKSNTHAGEAFANWAMAHPYFAKEVLTAKVRFAIGVNEKIAKPHEFDAGNLATKILIEFKSHHWTEGGNLPVAKRSSHCQTRHRYRGRPSVVRLPMVLTRTSASWK